MRNSVYPQLLWNDITTTFHITNFAVSCYLVVLDEHSQPYNLINHTSKFHNSLRYCLHTYLNTRSIIKCERRDYGYVPYLRCSSSGNFHEHIVLSPLKWWTADTENAACMIVLLWNILKASNFEDQVVTLYMQYVYKHLSPSCLCQLHVFSFSMSLWRPSI